MALAPFSKEEAITLTGNPFVDTGLAVLACLTNLDDVKQLTLGDIKRVHGDGSRLSGYNECLDNFTMVFTKNSLLTNASIKDRSKRIAMYRAVVNGLLEMIGREELPLRCESCGAARSVDFDRLCRFTISGITENEQARFVGRDWFPLAGSMGSDAQALPAASRPASLCAKCLFAVHYLPLGLMLLNGRLAVFQCTSVEFWYELVGDIAREMQVRIGAGNYGNIGAKEGSRAVTSRLLGLFERVQQAKRLSDIPPAAALEVWRFTNSNPPDCDITDIPNVALTFLWCAVGLGLRQEIGVLLNWEGKGERSFLECILERHDYGGLYPRGRNTGASPTLFALYQVQVCGRSNQTLALAHLLAKRRVGELGRKEVDRLKRKETFYEASVRSAFRGMIVRLASEGVLTLDDYRGLFPTTEDEPGIRVGFDGWNLIRYYLHHVNDFEAVADAPVTPRLSSLKNASLRYYAARIIQQHVDERGWNRFASEVLSRMTGRAIGLRWLQQRFVRLAEVYPGFVYAAWRDLVTDGGGNNLAGECLFQMRLLWTEWQRQEVIPDVNVPLFRDVPSPPGQIELRLRQIFSKYAQVRGLRRFHSDILVRLRRNEIGVYWIQRLLNSERYIGSEFEPISENAWEAFLRDEEGRPCAGERLFQIQLMLANLYRDARDSTEEVTA